MLDGYPSVRSTRLLSGKTCMQHGGVSRPPKASLISGQAELGQLLGHPKGVMLRSAVFFLGRGAVISRRRGASALFGTT
jgi:hypothetical protein